MDDTTKPGVTTSEWKTTAIGAVAAVVAALQSPEPAVQVAALWALALIFGTYNLARGIAKFGR